MWGVASITSFNLQLTNSQTFAHNIPNYKTQGTHTIMIVILIKFCYGRYS